MSTAGYHRNTARAVGALFLAGIAVYMTGNILVDSLLSAPDPLASLPASASLLATGALLMLMAAAFDGAHGILMLPVLRKHGERLAFGYLAARLFDAVLLAAGVILVLLQLPAARAYAAADAAGAASIRALSDLLGHAHLYAYEVGMMAVGVAGTMLCAVLHRAALVPRPIAAWGFFGYLLLFLGSTLQVAGFDLRLLHTIPGGLWELFIGFWLLLKGFDRPAAAPAEAAEGVLVG